MKQRKGMSLVEVMMGFVLIGFLILLVGGAVTSSYKTAAAMQKLPGLYFKGQQEIENDLEDLDKDVTRKYLLEKELGMASNPSGELQSELDALNEELNAGFEKVTVNIFGKDVVIYQFERSGVIDGVGHFTLHAGTASGVRLERPVPVIETASIQVLGEAAVPEITHADGKTITTEVTYSDVNREYCYTELFQWYVSTGSEHGIYYEDGTPGPEETQHGSIMPVYPVGFTPITSERTASMIVSEAYRGKFIFCLVTPLSMNGKMGESVMSNLIYVSDLPDGLNYRAVIDPSLMLIPFDDSGIVRVSLLGSTSASSGSFTVSSGAPYIDLFGEVMSEDGAASRFVHLDPDDKLKSSTALTSRPDDVIFMVVRTEDPDASPDFIKAGTTKYGFSTNSERIDSEYGLWSILVIENETSGSTYTIGGVQLNIAELIIASNPGSDGRARIIEYLQHKYGIG